MLDDCEALLETVLEGLALEDGDWESGPEGVPLLQAEDDKDGLDDELEDGEDEPQAVALRRELAEGCPEDESVGELVVLAQGLGE